MTGDFWNTSNPLKPWGLFDSDAKLDIPFTITDWLASMATTYASHQVLADAPLECVASAESSGIIIMRMQLLSSATYTNGTKYPFTIRLIGADGQQDDRTLWLKVVDR